MLRMSNFSPQEPTWEEERHLEATYQPHECSTQGGECLSVTFSEPLPSDPMVIILSGSGVTHKLQTNRIDDNTITAVLPAHSLAESVEFSVYWLPSSNSSPTYQAKLLFQDRILYSDMSKYLAELLVQSNIDLSQAHLFYSMLPPLAALDSNTLCEFDIKLRDAVNEVELPYDWSLAQEGTNKHDTLLHFAARNRLANLFSLLLILPGGRRALFCTNEEGKLPIDLAKESGCHEITRTIENLERDSNLSLPKSRLSCSSSFDGLPYSLELQIMRDINTEWIGRQRLVSNDMNGLLQPNTSISKLSPSLRRSSIAVMESNSSVCRLCIKDSTKGKSWSCIVGERMSRSVDTGLNELHRIRDQVTVHMTGKIDPSKTSLLHLPPKEVWLSGSCPTLSDDIESVSTDLVHSTLTSPGLLDSPTFLPDFTMPSLITQTDSSTAPPPHIALLTSSGNHGNNKFLSTSPSLNVPTVCIEDPENEMVCMDLGLSHEDKNDRDSTVKAKDLKELPDVSMSSGEEEDEDNRERDIISYPLSSKSAPDLQRAHAISVHSTRKEEEKSPRSHSVTDPLFIMESNEVMTGVKEEEEEEEEDLHLTTKSEVCIINPVSSPVTRSTTLSGTHSHKGRTHQKSFSLSEIQYCEEEEEEDDNKLSINVYDHDSRSRGSSFISNSSKVESSSDDEDDDQFHTASEADLKSKSATSLLTHSNTSLGLFPIQTEKISQSEEEMLSSEEDLLDGEVQIPSRQGRRHSDVKITNIDDFNSGSEEDESKQGLLRSSTVEQHLTSHDQKEKKELTPNTKEDDLALSDIDVKIDSLNSSYCGTLLELGITPIGNGVPPTSHLPVQSSSPRTSPRLSDPKTTIKQLQNIIRSESPVFSQTNFSDDSDQEGKERRKAITLPCQSPVAFRRSPIPSSPDLSKQHQKVARNFSSASDTKVMLHNKTTPISRAVLKTSESSSLDFVQMNDRKGSPRSPRQSHPSLESTPPNLPSQLFFAKSSPKVSPTRVLDDDSYSQRSPNRLVGSPLEKRVSKSADNLFSESGTDDTNTRETKEQSPSKKKSKEDTTVKLIRFEPLPEDSGGEGAKGVRKDLKAYYGIPVQQEGKEHKKGLSKLFRRDSKKEKRAKKSDSTTSFESLTSELPIKEKTKPSPVVYTSPEGRKPRSRTIHGDYNLENVFIDESQVPVPSKDPKQLHFQEVISPVEEDPPIIQNSVSPSTKSEFVFSAETENEKSDLSSLSIKLDEYPELMFSEETDVSWYRTIDRRLRRSMNKHEKGRQGVMFDWINTERHMHRAFIILKVVFRDKLSSEVSLGEEILNHLFPSLDELFEVSRNFSLQLQKRQRQSSTMIDDISDILLEQFTGPKGERMRLAYTDFVCRQPAAIEVYRELEKKRHKFVRVMNMLYANKFCERRKLPDFYLLIAQRVAKYVELMKKLEKETEALKLKHLPRVKETSEALQKLVIAVDQGVYEYNNRKELESIQNRLELPRTTKNKKLKGLQTLDLTAQNRLLLKRGDANWQGHGKHLSVHIVLVTDLLVLLTERDQKYTLASLQDLQPPVIKLMDLHVRVNASVKSGVQLLLLEQGKVPEMFRIEFLTKKLAKEWEEALNKAVEYCKENNLKCECFGAESTLSGDETKEEEEEQEDEFDESLPSDLSPNSLRRFMINQALEQATRVLSLPSLSSSLVPSDDFQLRNSIAPPTVSMKESPKLRNKPNRSTTFNTSRGISVDVAELKRKSGKKPGLERGKSFKFEETVDKDKQMLLDCILKLKDSVEYLIEQNDEKDTEIHKLKQNIEDMQEERRNSVDESSPVPPRSSSQRSSFKNRPHSVHSDLFENGPSDVSRLYPQSQSCMTRPGGGWDM